MKPPIRQDFQGCVTSLEKVIKDLFSEEDNAGNFMETLNFHGNIKLPRTYPSNVHTVMAVLMAIKNNNYW